MPRVLPPVPPGAVRTTGYRTAVYYPTALFASNSTAAMVDGKLRYIPMWVGRTQTFDRIGISVTTLIAASVIRLGIYHALADGTPGTLNEDFGTVDSSTTGGKEITIAKTLSAGLHWVAVVAQGGGPSTNTGMLISIGVGMEALTNLNAATPFQNGVAGALPSPAVVSFGHNQATGTPLVLWRSV